MLKYFRKSRLRYAPAGCFLKRSDEAENFTVPQMSENFPAEEIALKTLSAI